MNVSERLTGIAPDKHGGLSLANIFLNEENEENEENEQSISGVKEI